MTTIKVYQQDDFDPIACWVADQNLFVQWGGSRFSYPLSRDEFHAHHNNEGTNAYIAVNADQEIIGYFEVRVIEPTLGRISRVIVSPNHRGQHIGQLMTQAALHIGFEEIRFQQIGLSVFSWNMVGIRCYESCGLQAIGESVRDNAFLGQVAVIDMAISRTHWVSAVKNEGE